MGDTSEDNIQRLERQLAEERARRSELEDILSRQACSDHGESPRVVFDQGGPTIVASCPEARMLGEAVLREWADRGGPE